MNVPELLSDLGEVRIGRAKRVLVAILYSFS